MDNKRYLLALALSMGIILIWMQFVMPPAKPPVSVPAKPGQVPSIPVPPVSGKTPSQAGGVEQAPEAPVGTAPAETPPKKEEAAASEERTVETDLFRVRFVNRGARILSWQLKKYQDDAGKPLELVSIASPKLKRFPLDLEFDDANRSRTPCLSSRYRRPKERSRPGSFSVTPTAPDWKSARSWCSPPLPTSCPWSRRPSVQAVRCVRE